MRVVSSQHIKSTQNTVFIDTFQPPGLAARTYVTIKSICLNIAKSTRERTLPRWIPDIH